MTVFRNDDHWDRSNVLFEGRPLLRYDKTRGHADMRHIDYGLGVLTARALARVPADQPFDLAAVYQRLLAEGELLGVEVAERFYEIGSPEGLEETRAFLASRTDGCRRPRREPMTYTRQHLDEVARIVAGPGRRRASSASRRHWPRCASRGGRLFFLGVGGSAGNCSHAVNDFRKLAGFEAYAPTDNVSELTARTNDEGWDTVFAAWLAGQPAAPGGRRVRALGRRRQRREEHQREPGARAAVRAEPSAPPSSGSSAAMAATRPRSPTACVIVPTVNPETVTPHSEAFQAVVWHLLVSHPLLKTAATKWESTR